MKKVLLTSAILGGLFMVLGGLIVWVVSPVDSAVPAKTTASSRPASNQELNAERNGVAVTVSGVERRGGETLVILEMNNHQYDLSAFDLKGRATLGGQLATVYTVLDNQIGGHHVRSQLTFLGEPRGRLVIPLAADLIFNFELP